MNRLSLLRKLKAQMINELLHLLARPNQYLCNLWMHGSNQLHIVIELSLDDS